MLIFATRLQHKVAKALINVNICVSFTNKITVFPKNIPLHVQVKAKYPRVVD
jgi:hypothetical protein